VSYVNDPQKRNGILYALRYGGRVYEMTLQDVVNHLQWERVDAPIEWPELSGSQIERLLTFLRKDGLIDSVPKQSGPGRKWVLTENGEYHLDLVLKVARDGAPLTPLGPRSRVSPLAAPQRLA
jgi:DNA-binding PadR family transcriptional regulator